MNWRELEDKMQEYVAFESVEEFYNLFAKATEQASEKSIAVAQKFLKEQQLEEKFLNLVNLKYKDDVEQLCTDLRCSGSYEAVRCFISYKQSAELYPDIVWPELLEQHFYPNI